MHSYALIVSVLALAFAGAAVAAGIPPRGPVNPNRAAKAFPSITRDPQRVQTWATAIVTAWAQLHIERRALHPAAMVNMLVEDYNCQCEAPVCSCVMPRGRHDVVVVDQEDMGLLIRHLQQHVPRSRYHRPNRLQRMLGMDAPALKKSDNTSFSLRTDGGFHHLVVCAKDRKDAATGRAMELHLRIRQAAQQEA